MTTQAPGGALYSVLPLRDIVVFPHMIVPLFLSVAKNPFVRSKDAMQDDKQILAAHPKRTRRRMIPIATISTPSVQSALSCSF